MPVGGDSVVEPPLVVAVNTIFVPFTAVVLLADSTRVEATLAVTTPNAVEVLPFQFVSPEYTAVMECVPAPVNVTVAVAEPATSGAVPTVFVPSRKVTVPV